jgi:hypothetical protein
MKKGLPVNREPLFQSSRESLKVPAYNKMHAQSVRKIRFANYILYVGVRFNL